MAKRLKAGLAASLPALSAHAYQYPLQFSPSAEARGLVVAGYRISASAVTATNGSSTTGSDTALLPNHGYVDTPSAHYTWGSDDYDVASVRWRYAPRRGVGYRDYLACPLTHDLDELHWSDTCRRIGSISIYYDPTRLAYPMGLMYDALTVTMQSNSPGAGTFSSHSTIRVRAGDND